MRAFVFVTIALAAATVACDIETTPNPQADAGSDALTGSDADAGAQPPALEQRFVEEPYGIGASWYAYDSTTHALTPRPNVYRLERGDQAYAFEVDSYYDERGESGFFTLRLREWADGEWSAPRVFEAQTNAKENAVCVDLAQAAEVDCESPDHDLVLKTDLRVVPSAGFAVQNPAIYAATHHGDSDVAYLAVQSTESVEDVRPDAWRPLENSVAHPEHALLAPYLTDERLGQPSPLFLQATGAFELALWRVTTRPDAIEIESACVELASSSQAQAPLSTDAMTRTTISWPEDGTSLVTLCTDNGPAVATEFSAPPRGQWSSTDTFALFVERYAERPTVRVAPGHLLWSTGSTDFHGIVSPPDHLWE